MARVEGRLHGKVAVVTGAAHGIGAAIVGLFTSEDGRVVVADIDDEAGSAVAAEIGAAAVFVRHDVSSEPGWEAVVAGAVDRFGRLDVLVNNAGVVHHASVADTTLADFERLVRVNQIGVFLGMRAVIEPMRRA
ncbi:MAG TPA: SDR family NAD(P)-dependent oxidoreductase, partial [Acidimicrobiales bacterium]|nr:SDR family NAD(P)-dependent oxidoreductase [Acidimicrobiales bacterium]